MTNNSLFTAAQKNELHNVSSQAVWLIIRFTDNRQRKDSINTLNIDTFTKDSSPAKCYFIRPVTFPHLPYHHLICSCHTELRAKPPSLFITGRWFFCREMCKASKPRPLPNLCDGHMWSHAQLRMIDKYHQQQHGACALEDAPSGSVVSPRRKRPHNAGKTHSTLRPSSMSPGIGLLSQRKSSISRTRNGELPWCSAALRC